MVGPAIDGKFINGPEAFLTALLRTIQDAKNRLEELTRRVDAFITPPVSNHLHYLVHLPRSSKQGYSRITLTVCLV